MHLPAWVGALPAGMTKMVLPTPLTKLSLQSVPSLRNAPRSLAARDTPEARLAGKDGMGLLLSAPMTAGGSAWLGWCSASQR